MSNLKVRNIHPNERSFYNENFQILDKTTEAPFGSYFDKNNVTLKIPLFHKNFVLYETENLSSSKKAILCVLTDGTTDKYRTKDQNYIYENEIDISSLNLTANDDKLIIIVLNDHPKDYYSHSNKIITELTNYIEQRVHSSETMLNFKEINDLLDSIKNSSQKSTSHQKRKAAPKEAAGGIIIK